MRALLGLLLIHGSTFADPKVTANYDETKVGRYELPDPLRSLAGRNITTTAAWENERRPELVKLFAEHVYGVSPGGEAQTSCVIQKDQVLGDRRDQSIRVTVSRNGRSHAWTMLLRTPKAGRAPVALGLVAPDFAYPTSPAAIQTALRAGVGVATVDYRDVQPDRPDTLTGGLAGLFPELQTRDDNFAALTAWAYGLSRGLDCLVKNPAVDAAAVTVFGHSRLGKTALWAGALDRRFRAVFANESGEGGAALARRNFGETVRAITTRFPHWFAKRYASYGDDLGRLPVDQHELVALIAPRPVYVTSAADDAWGDPLGEYLGARGAAPVYALYGLGGPKDDHLPPPRTPVGAAVRYHLRPGAHDLAPYDWDQLINFCGR